MDTRRKIFILLVIALILAAVNIVQAANPKNDDLLTITDIDHWNHPVKNVFRKNQIVLDKVELKEGKTLPVFHLRFPKPLTKDTVLYYWGVIRQVAKANGYWNYRMIDEHLNLKIDALCCRQPIQSQNVVVNGDSSSFRTLLDTRTEEDFHKAVAYLCKTVPEIRDFDRQVQDYAKTNKIKAKLIFRHDGEPDPTSSNPYLQRYIEIYVGTDMETHTSRWLTFLVRQDFKEILVEDPAASEMTYISLSEWRRRMKA